MKKDMSKVFKEAHAMTRKFKKEYKDIDYRTQFGLCLSYLLSRKEVIKIEGIKSWLFVPLNKKIYLGKTVSIEYTIEHETEKAILIKQIETKHRKRGTRQLKMDIWLPKSQIAIYKDQDLISVPDWIACQRHLLTRRAICDLNNIELEKIGLDIDKLSSTDRLNLINQGLGHWEEEKYL